MEVGSKIIYEYFDMFLVGTISQENFPNIFTISMFLGRGKLLLHLRKTKNCSTLGGVKKNIWNYLRYLFVNEPCSK